MWMSRVARLSSFVHFLLHLTFYIIILSADSDGSFPWDAVDSTYMYSKYISDNLMMFSLFHLLWFFVLSPHCFIFANIYWAEKYSGSHVSSLWNNRSTERLAHIVTHRKRRCIIKYRWRNDTYVCRIEHDVKWRVQTSEQLFRWVSLRYEQGQGRREGCVLDIENTDTDSISLSSSHRRTRTISCSWIQCQTTIRPTHTNRDDSTVMWRRV